MWEIDDQIATSLPYNVPENYPPDHTFVPPSLRTQLITCAHTPLSPLLIGHHGTQHTYHLLRGKYWWPNMVQDVKRISSCSVCAKSKVPCTLTAGKFKPLPMPVWPRSHFAIDFVTELTMLQVNVAIMVIIDRFSLCLTNCLASLQFFTQIRASV